MNAYKINIYFSILGGDSSNSAQFPTTESNSGSRSQFQTNTDNPTATNRAEYNNQTPTNNQYPTGNNPTYPSGNPSYPPNQGTPQYQSDNAQYPSENSNATTPNYPPTTNAPQYSPMNTSTYPTTSTPHNFNDPEKPNQYPNDKPAEPATGNSDSFYNNQYVNPEIKTEPNQTISPTNNQYYNQTYPNQTYPQQNFNAEVKTEPGQQPYYNNQQGQYNNYYPPPPYQQQPPYPQQNMYPPNYQYNSWQQNQQNPQNQSEVKDEKMDDKSEVKSEIKSELKTELKEEDKMKDDGIIKIDDVKSDVEKIETIDTELEDGEIPSREVFPTAKLKEDAGINYDWAVELLKGYVPGCIENSAKMEILFCIVEESMALGDRILLFSQSLFTLNLIEEFLQRYQVPGHEEKWARNVNYYRKNNLTFYFMANRRSYLNLIRILRKNLTCFDK